MNQRISLRVLSFLFIVGFVYAKEQPAIIPQPKSIRTGAGYFQLSASTKIVIANDFDALSPVIEDFRSKLQHATGYRFESVTNSTPGNNGNIFFQIDSHLGKEAYNLSVGKNHIGISAGATQGIFYAMQTLYQLLPAEIERDSIDTNAEWKIPAVEIEDSPRFSWRGMHLDVCRHFFPVEFIKKYIDLMASYKMNTFHWHLTEDQGWRIEIKKYPRLTEVGSKRRETMGDGTPYGGFYTQDQIRDVVGYAKRRFITIVPEIEMPGHSLAALASYPEFSCSGGPFKVGTEWGVENDVYCAGNDKTFEFLQSVLDEVMELFPGEVIHIGGDEVPKVRWKNCVKCQARIKAEKLKDENELQSYFICRIEKYLNAHGRRIIGWDEILEGGIAPNASIMSWRGTDGGIAAAKAGHDAVMSPGTNCYFDHCQGKSGEPLAIGGYLPLEKVYEYEPVPRELTDDQTKHILGAQGNMWTEYMPTESHVEYMLMPRMMALSEVVWSTKEHRNLENFLQRLNKHYPRLEVGNVNFRVPPPQETGGKIFYDGKMTFTMSQPISHSTIHYTLDGSEPSELSPVYLTPIKVSGNMNITARTFYEKNKMSPAISTKFIVVNPKTNGINYEYFEGKWDSLPDFSSLRAIKKGHVYEFSLDDIPHREDFFGVRLSGILRIEQDGEYALSTSSDDGSRLFIDDRQVVNNNGLHGKTEVSNKIYLAKGRYHIRVEFFERDGDEFLETSIEGPGISKQTIPSAMLTQK